ncbi:trace amine-associated receptor 8a-like [Salarias fasciatus]|uniref:trace amine-associated receptor 8a-like n=1 Tax=Salarias fasciatus TaxID=181472 RepID=UPI0011765E1A|nr:trace amine-associated receptor 8a-like [Salarias fasciatus]
MTTPEGAELCYPRLHNLSCKKTVQPHSESTLICILLSSISVLTVLLNLLLIIAISHFKKLHTPTNLLLLSLAFSDFFVGFLMAVPIMLIEGCWYIGDMMCAVYYILGCITTAASAGTVVLISIDRYMAICDPLHYPTKVTQSRANMCISVCWVSSMLFHCMVLRDNIKQPGRYNTCYGECIVVVDYVTGIADIFFSFVFPVTVITVLYIRVFVVAVSQARAMRSQVTAVTLQGSVKVTVNKSEMKAARTLGVVVIAFLICLLPYYCVMLTGQDAYIDASKAPFLISIYYFNSFLNPLIYALFYPWSRESIKLIVTCQILRPGSCYTSFTSH